MTPLAQALEREFGAYIPGATAADWEASAEAIAATTLPTLDALTHALRLAVIDTRAEGHVDGLEADLVARGILRRLAERPAPPSGAPEHADWIANGLVALDHLEELFWSGSGLTAASWDAATDVIRAALSTPAERTEE